VLLNWAAPSEKDVLWSFLAKDLALQLLFVGLSVGAIRFSWWLVGGKAAARSFFVAWAYLWSVGYVIVNLHAVLAYGVLKTQHPKLYEKFIAATPAQADAMWDEIVASSEAYRWIVGISLTAAVIWTVISWGAFRSLTGSSKLRSFFAFMIFFILLIPSVLLVYSLNSALMNS